ncbi:UDP-N-acetyl-D-galactosamine dehydrogenase [Pseudoxanthobacter soli DSM 19599]|uniref:UDP-N-acetyl-D-galactosamine dehydrogenase n=1 Tax=Pseudoxanthobacter soli DSM 19599 TaxID=1123029 RepID=A0A1M7ZMI3_9HYPH|nr:nucleotide sugar dehydrogenase [Pseudoxanthobacter soli]SHO66114.1 UDP-N-acetyl-D-galactosamine dehydrogenase [Pseudoxanthobacter soli DSM 19599]
MLDLTPATRVGLIGLGYVGLPLAVAFGRRYETVGFDRDAARVGELAAGRDRTLEVDAATLAAADRLVLTADPADLAGCDVFIVTVPTPVDRHKRPDLSFLIAASETVGRVIRPGAVVVFESTVYPGATEEDCVPVIERVSGLVFNRDFFAGYSPERINPGDRARRLETVIKVTSGSTPEAAAFVDALYGSVVPAGTHRAPSIRVAEAAKVIENTQRDLNIALVNELAIIFSHLGIDTEDVLKAAGTKWNFLPFRPGLVGGHCIGVDPYYLTHKAQSVGYHPEIILAGRRINDGMGAYVAGELVKAMLRRRIQVAGARILVLGLTFKENCPDLRNSRVIDIIRELEAFGAAVDVHDPWADPAAAAHEYGVTPIDAPAPGHYDAVVVAVAHEAFREMGYEGIAALTRPDRVIFDVKYVVGRGHGDVIRL